MRKEADDFGDRELALVFLARKLTHAIQLEEALTAAGIDYYVEAEPFVSGTILKRQRVGAFFYVLPEIEADTRRVIGEAGFQPYEAQG